MATISTRIGATLSVSASDPLRVVADTGPLNYLVLVEQADVLAALFAMILVPEAVRTELSHPETPALVRAWIAAPPSWLLVQPDVGGADPALARLGAGEREAILLTLAVGADLILMDDRAGVAAARTMGFAVTGTLGLIDLAARRGLIDVAGVVARLRATSFRCRPELFDDLLARHQLP